MRESNIQNARINTAGAYIFIEGYFVFAIGIRPHNGHFPIVRLGGHCEEQETGWECAVREVYEEARLHIQPLLPKTTCFCEWDQIDTGLQEVQWQPDVEGEPIPVIIGRYCREDKIHLSLMYLAQAEGAPEPSCEVKGLLFLREEEVHHLCQETVTLEQYLHWGGKAILNAEFDKRLVLEPFAQLRLLSRVLILQRKQAPLS